MSAAVLILCPVQRGPLSRYDDHMTDHRQGIQDRVLITEETIATVMLLYHSS